MQALREILRWRELFANLVQRELKGKYKRTALGQLWSLANPIALMLVYTFVFKYVFRITPEPGDPSGLDAFPLWLLCGLLPWLFFAKTVQQGMSSLVENAPLIRKVYFPRSLLVVSMSAALSVTWLTEMGVLLVALVIAGAWMAVVYSPVALLFMALLLVFSAGVALLAAIANAYFRDTEHLVAVALQLGMYLTPIIYPLSLVLDLSNQVGPVIGSLTLYDIYALNPLVHFVEAFRDLLYDNRLPTAFAAIACSVSAIAVFVLGWWVFTRHEKKLAEVL
jgi:ABC-2 type transport system permease protein